ncbi:uracil phosphoribosyltransferase [Nocardioides sp. CF8]|nr:uracil phosphoribosyltransferase [Nocardioides sp. CF8]
MHAEVGEQVEVARGGHVVVLEVDERRQAEELERRLGQVPLLGGRDVAEEDAGRGTVHAHDHEEVLVDGDQSHRALVAGQAPQRGAERLDRLVGRRGDVLHLPPAVVPVGGQREVDTVELVVHGESLHASTSVTPSVADPPRGGNPVSPRATRVRSMRTHVVDHPLVSHKLTTLRDVETDSPTFRRLTDELVTLLAYEATREVRVVEHTINTPVAPATGVKLASPKPLVVPILRAGLGMLDGMMRLLPTAEVGFLGMVRNEETLEASTYAERLPEDLSGRQCYVLDPMLATGGTLAAAIRFLTDRGADDITAICLLVAPEGLANLEAGLEGLDVPVTVVTAALDERLNEKGYIVPGLGDAGDRLYGVAH